MTREKTNPADKNSVAKKPVAAPATAAAATGTKTPATKKPVTNSSTAKSTASTKAATKPVKKTTEPALVKTNTDQHKIESLRKDSIQTMSDKKPIAIPLPKELSSRSNELVKTLTLSTREVQLNVYDDGAVDNDTVSIYFDRKLLVSHARLTTQPIIVKIHLDESSDTHELVMVAENLGDIPPNTSLMVVRAGEKRFEVRIVSTEQKNAVVVFKYEKPE
jgi:hypothetical protein